MVSVPSTALRDSTRPPSISALAVTPLAPLVMSFPRIVPVVSVDLPSTELVSRVVLITTSERMDFARPVTLNVMVVWMSVPTALTVLLVTTSADHYV